MHDIFSSSCEGCEELGLLVLPTSWKAFEEDFDAAPFTLCFLKFVCQMWGFELIIKMLAKLYEC